MSNPDGFIQEVTEEVRRDRFFQFLKRYGWAIGLGVAIVVGGAAWIEWSKAQDRAVAQSFGDAVLSALEERDDTARAAALQAVETATSAQALVKTLLVGANAQANEESAAAAAAWGEVAQSDDIPELYRDLALLKAQLSGGTGDADEDARILSRLANPGAPYRSLALERQALNLMSIGESAAAITGLREAIEDPSATEGLRRRAQQLIVALGGSADPI